MLEQGDFLPQFGGIGLRDDKLGGGPGNITRYLLSKRPDFHIQAIDVAPNMIKLAKDNNPGADFKVIDCREISTLEGNFDGIMCDFCMPYLSKEECGKLIQDCAALLNSDGILYFSTIEGDCNDSGFETSSNGQSSMFVCYHQEDYLREMLREHHFELAGILRKGYSKPDGTLSTHLIFIAMQQ